MTLCLNVDTLEAIYFLKTEINLSKVSALASAKGVAWRLLDKSGQPNDCFDVVPILYFHPIMLRLLLTTICRPLSQNRNHCPRTGGRVLEKTRHLRGALVIALRLAFSRAWRPPDDAPLRWEKVPQNCTGQYKGTWHLRRHPMGTAGIQTEAESVRETKEATLVVETSDNAILSAKFCDSGTSSRILEPNAGFRSADGVALQRVGRAAPDTVLNSLRQSDLPLVMVVGTSHRWAGR